MIEKTKLDSEKRGLKYVTILTHDGVCYELTRDAFITDPIHNSHPDSLCMEARAVDANNNEYRVFWEFAASDYLDDSGNPIELDELDYTLVSDIRAI